MATGFPKIDHLVSIAVPGTPVHANILDDTDITAARMYNNHSSVLPDTAGVINRFARGRSVRARFSISPSIGQWYCGTDTVAVGISGVHVEKSCNTLSRGAHADTDFSTTTPCQLAHVLREVVWRV